jgi:hypothetical protein
MSLVVPAIAVALIIGLAALGVDRIVCHVLRKRHERNEVKEHIAILGFIAESLGEAMVELVERVEKLEAERDTEE